MSENERIENFNFQIGEAGPEITIRHGEAPEVHPPRGIRIMGQPGTVAEFVQMREPDPKSTHVEVDREKGTITLTANEHLPDAGRTAIRSSIKLDPAFLEFKVNTNEPWDPVQLGKLFKRRRRYFSDSALNLKLVSLLTNFKAKVDSQLEKVDDRSTRRFKEAVEKVIQSELPQSFKISLPIVKGVPAEEFEVEFVMEAREGAIYIYLDSVEAEEIAESAKNTAINEEIEMLAGVYPVFEV